MLTLWDLIPTRSRAGRGGKRRESLGVPPVAGARGNGCGSKRDLYESMAREVLAAHGIRVRRWRRSMSGIAWAVRYGDGSVARLIEAPRPKGPMSAAVFLHEVGHHAIGLGRYRPRCLEEYHAWEWALGEMDRWGIVITEGVRYRMHQSLAYAVEKARRRGIRALPAELSPYTRSLPWRRRGRANA